MEVELCSEPSKYDTEEQYTQVRLSLSWLISNSQFVRWLAPWLGSQEQSTLPLKLQPNGSHRNGFHSNRPLIIPASFKEKIPQVVQRIRQSGLYNRVFLLGRIFISMIPYLLFVITYRLNSRLHILPVYEDLDKVDSFYNVGNFERYFFPRLINEILSENQSHVFDVFAFTVYMLHFVIPYVFPLYLWWKRRPDDIIRFYYTLGCFLWVQYIIWYNFPTPPPWVYENQRLYASTKFTPPLEEHHREGCLFHRVDEFIGFKVFFNMFRKGNVPFGAFPSGHVAWPMSVAVNNPPGGKYFWLYILWISWSTMYSCHHFVSDVVAAIILVCIIKRVITRVEKRKSRMFRMCLR